MRKSYLFCYANYIGNLVLLSVSLLIFMSAFVSIRQDSLDQEEGGGRERGMRPGHDTGCMI